MTIAKLFKNYKPYLFFTLVAIVLFILSLGFFIPVLASFLHTGIVEKIPTVVVCGITMLASIISYFSGLVLDTMKQKSRQDFEMELQRANDRYKDLLNNDKEAFFEI